MKHLLQCKASGLAQAFSEVLTLNISLTQHRVDLKDCSLFYQQGGVKTDAPPLLFLHGWGISSEPYAEILRLLAQQHTVIAPDLPSFGRSSYSNLIPDYESYAEFLLAFLEALDLPKVHVAGHSLGGGIALTMAALCPDKVDRLILIGSTGIPTFSLLEIAPRRAVEMTVQTFLPHLELKFVKIPQVFSHNLLFNTGNVLQALLLSLQADIRHLFPKIQAPALLLWSDQDLTEPIAIAQEMAATLPNAKLVTVEEGCHEWALWYPEKLASIVLEFIQQREQVGLGR